MKIYQVDAFSSSLFGGNPAAVCPLKSWLSAETMQKIAAENNLAETAFFVPNGHAYDLRWFTPAIEVDLCGHATLASAHVLFHHLGYSGKSIYFNTRSGELKVSSLDDSYTMNFPSDIATEVETPQEIIDGLSLTPLQTFKGKDDYMVVVENQRIIEQLQPDFRQLLQLSSRGTIVTAPGNTVDFVSRCFFPQAGIDEDPTTGSAHTVMTPYWAERLSKNELTAMQLSNRVGHLSCNYLGERVEIIGQAVTYMVGEIMLNTEKK